VVAEDYRVDRFKRLINQIMTWMARRGMGPAVALTTTGRRSGQPRTVPVSPIVIDGAEYLVAPYGEVGWVVNAREHPDAVLRKGRDERRVRLAEVGTEAPSIIAAYYERERFPRRYMDLPESPTIDDFEASASIFPVFKVEPVAAQPA
jgi:deazaflavin-dependent oxidoreductase (nitroreductase family)